MLSCFLAIIGVKICSTWVSRPESHRSLTAGKKLSNIFIKPSTEALTILRTKSLISSPWPPRCGQTGAYRWICEFQQAFNIPYEPPYRGIWRLQAPTPATIFFTLGLLSAEKPPVALNSDNLQMATEKHYGSLTCLQPYSTGTQS